MLTYICRAIAVHPQRLWLSCRVLWLNQSVHGCTAAVSYCRVLELECTRLRDLRQIATDLEVNLEMDGLRQQVPVPECRRAGYPLVLPHVHVPPLPHLPPHLPSPVVPFGVQPVSVCQKSVDFMTGCLNAQ